MQLWKRKPSRGEMRSEIAIAWKKLEMRERSIGEKRAKARDDAKEALARGDERSYTVASRRYSLLDGQYQMVQNLSDMAESTLDIIDIEASVEDVVRIGTMLAGHQRALGISNDRLHEALSSINSSMENLTRASEVISSTVDAIADTSPEVTSTEESLRGELLAELEAESAGEEREGSELKRRIRDAQEA